MSYTVQNSELLEKGAVTTSERWRADLLARWRGAQAIIIQHCKHPEKKAGFAKIQRIALQTSKRSPMPDASVDDIIDAIAESIYGWLALQAEEGKIDPAEQVHFAIEVQRCADAGSGPKRPKWWVAASLESEEDDPYDSFEEQAISELERQRNAHIENLQRYNDHLTLHVESLHGTLLAMATNNNAPLKEVASWMHMANEMAMSGMQSMMHAKMLEYSSESKRIEEEGKSKRIEMWMKGVGQHVLPYIPAIAAHFMGKIFGGKSAPVQTPQTTPQEQEEYNAQVDRYWVGKLSELRTSFTPQQEEILEDTLTKTERALLRKALAAQSFEEAADTYGELLTVLDMETLQETITTVFTDAQKAAVIEFHSAVCAWMEAKQKAEQHEQETQEQAPETETAE